MSSNQTNPSSNAFNRKFLYTAILTLFVGLLPLVLYPFSEYYGRESEFAEMNHGPFHQYPGGDYQVAAPQGVDWIIDVIFGWPPILFFLLLVGFFIVLLFRKQFKIAFAYLLIALINFALFFLQMGLIYWLYD